MPTTPTVVACPQCGASVVWSAENPVRPFCSERCKMIDLGAWATEAYRVPVAESEDVDVPFSSNDADAADKAATDVRTRGSKRR